MNIDTGALATTVVTSFLLPYVKLGLDKLVEKLGETAGASVASSASKATKNVWERVKSAFTGVEDSKRLEKFEDSKGEENEEIIRLLLKEKLENDPNFATELYNMVESDSDSHVSAGAQIMRAHIAGILDARGATISGQNVRISAVNVRGNNAADAD